MNTIIELHDSKVAMIDRQDGDAVVHFLPAYLHKSDGRSGYDPGTGWVQEVQLILREATVEGEFPDWPCHVLDGALTIDGARHDNSIPVPLTSEASAELMLIFDSVHAVTVAGRDVRLEFCGAPKYVEEFEP
jgi:hypothetical protein